MVGNAGTGADAANAARHCGMRLCRLHICSPHCSSCTFFLRSSSYLRCSASSASVFGAIPISRRNRFEGPATDYPRAAAARLALLQRQSSMLGLRLHVSCTLRVPWGLI